jgi:hypothetical protein
VQADQADLINEFVTNRHTVGEANAAISAFKARIKARAKQLVPDMMARYQASEEGQTAENVGFLIGYVAVAFATRGRVSVTHMANRQSALVRTQADYLRLHPSVSLLHRVRVIQCDGMGRGLRCRLE